MNTDTGRHTSGENRQLVATAEQVMLAFLAQDPFKSYYERQVADRTGLSRGAVNGAGRALAAAGLLRGERKGRMRFYSADLEDPRVRAFKLCLNAARLMPLVRRLKPHALRVVLFGSAAEGRNVPESDFDLLVVASDPDRARALLPKRGLPIQAVVVTPAGLAEMESREPAFAGQLRRGFELWQRQ